MKMEFVDEAELQKAAEEPEDDLRGVVKNVKISAVSDQMLVGDLV